MYLIQVWSNDQVKPLLFQVDDNNVCHLAAAIIKEGEKDISIVKALKPDDFVKILQECGETFDPAVLNQKHNIRILRKANDVIIKTVIARCYCQALYKKK